MMDPDQLISLEIVNALTQEIIIGPGIKANVYHSSESSTYLREYAIFADENHRHNIANKVYQYGHGAVFTIREDAFNFFFAELNNVVWLDDKLILSFHRA
jgi:hypothetical protein